MMVFVSCFLTSQSPLLKFVFVHSVHLAQVIYYIYGSITAVVSVIQRRDLLLLLGNLDHFMGYIHHANISCS